MASRQDPGSRASRPAPHEDDPGTPAPGRRGWTITVLLTVAVLLGLAIYSDVGALLDALGGFDLVYVPAILGLTLLAYALRFAKWHLFLDVIGGGLGAARSAAVFFSGLMMAITPGKVGEVWKAWLTERSGGADVARVLPAIAAERVTDLVALAGLAALGLHAYGAPGWTLAAVGIAFVGLVGLVRSRSICLALLDRIDTWPVVGGFAEEIETIYESSFELFAPGPLAASLLLSLLAWGLEGIALWAALAGLGVKTGWVLPVFAFGLGSVLGALSMLPGGLGAAEGSMVGALVAAGVARAPAVGATLIVRAGTLWFGAVLGALVYLSTRGRLELARPDDV